MTTEQYDIGGEIFEVKRGESILLNGKTVEADTVDLGNGHFHMLLNGKGYNISVITEGEQMKVCVNGCWMEVGIKSESDLLLESLGINKLRKATSTALKAPMPGLVLRLLVNAGETVVKGQPLVVLEAMKMENILKAPHDAVVKSVKATQGTAVEKNTELIEFE